MTEDLDAQLEARGDVAEMERDELVTITGLSFELVTTSFRSS